MHADYEEKKPPVSNAKTLQDTWTGARDTRHYADKLINFGHPQIPEKDFRAEGVQVDMTTDETIIKVSADNCVSLLLPKPLSPG